VDWGKQLLNKWTKKDNVDIAVNEVDIKIDQVGSRCDKRV